MAVVAGMGLRQTADNCFIHTGLVAGHTTALRLVGRIYRQPTGDRGSPPNCLNAFATIGTPFARGHIMALELGGADIPANIVPQYGEWQGKPNGDWRRMEIAAEAATLDADVFVAEISYAGGPFLKTYQQQFDDFSNGDKLFHWQEARIPTRFRVWTVGIGWSSGGVSVANYFAAPNNVKDGLVGPLIAALPGGRMVFDATISVMPDVDRAYWRKQMINGFVRHEYVIFDSQQKSDIRKIRAKNERLIKEQEEKASQRKSRRLAVKNSHIIGLRKEPVSIGMHDWARDPNVQRKMIDKLKNTLAPPTAVTGWTVVELAGLQPQHIEEAIFV